MPLLDVYTLEQKPEEEWKFPDDRSHANNHAKYRFVVGEENISKAIC